MSQSIDKAIKLRENKNFSEAVEFLNRLIEEDPKNPEFYYQLAWTYDNMGEEHKALKNYETSIQYNLNEKDLPQAYLGLGSTLRCLGKYKESLDVFNKALKKFPKSNALKTFKSLSLFNLDQHEDCTKELLKLLLETTADKEIQKYKKALLLYSKNLKKEWEENQV